MTKVSWSQVNTFNDCPRKWASEKLDGIKSESSPAMELGSFIHDEIEQAIKGQENTKPYVVTALELVEKFNPTEYEAERWLNYSQEDIEIAGKADVVIDKPRRVIIDWKTGKRPKDVPHKVISQLHLYGYMSGFSLGDTVVASWPQYGLAKEIPYDPYRGEDVLEYVVETGKQIQEITENFTSAKELKGTPSFMGCKYCACKDTCPDEYNKRKKELQH